MKRKYSEGVSARKEAARLDAELHRRIESGEWRAKEFGANWQEVDFDGFCAKFAPGSVPQAQNGKLVFRSPGANLEIVADVGGGYCRLKDTTRPKGEMYLGIDGNPVPHNYVDDRGVQHGLPKSARKQLTHFKIKPATQRQ